MTGYARLCLRTALTVLWVLCIIPPLLVTWQLRLENLNSRMMQLSFYVGSILWGIRVKIKGTLSSKRPLLVVSNHFSYLDVFALGGHMPARFITKSEVASWPVVGYICRMGGCVFIDRRPSKTLHNVSELGYVVKQKTIISLFPEGTTNDGTGLLPFKSSFFSIAEEFDIDVQPVSVVYTALGGKPLDATTRPIVGWYGDAFFFPHVMKFLQMPSVDVTLMMHEPVGMEKFESRKQLASYCREVIEKPLLENLYAT